MKAQIGAVRTVFVTTACVIAAVPVAAQVSFTKTDLSTGSGSGAMVLADVNRDGRPDFILANVVANTFSISLATGPGIFGARTDVPNGSTVGAIAVADINRDGKLDVVTGSATASAVSVFLGNGDGTFQPRIDSSAGNDIVDIAAADLDRDGKLDLVTVSLSSGVVSMLAGDGAGQFGAKHDVFTGSGPRAVAVADVNVDGKIDVLVANGSPSGVVLLRGNGDGLFQAPTSISTAASPTALAVADLNRDGKLDLAVALSPANSLAVFLGDGIGAFTLLDSFATGSSPTAVGVADFNGDGRLDLAAVNAGSDTVSIFLANPGGSFDAKLDFATAAWPSRLAAMSIEGDARPDLLVSTMAGGMTSFLRNTTAFTPAGSFLPWTSFGTDGHTPGVAVADLNLDGRTDVVAIGNQEGLCNCFFVFLGTGDSTFSRTTYSAGTGPRDLAVEDLNRDGLADLVAADFVAPGKLVVRLATAPGVYSTGTGIATPRTTTVVSGDFDRDGVLDLASDNSLEGTFSIFLGTGAGTFGAATTFPGSITHLLADFNRDGKLDLAGTSLYFGNGDGTFQPGLSFPGAAAVADLNGDGIPDIVKSEEGNYVTVFLGNGDGTFKTGTNFTTGVSTASVSRAVAVADVNRDGKLDLIVSNDRKELNVPFTVSVLLGTGTGSFGPGTDFDTGGEYLRGLTVADLNRDGRPDIVGVRFALGAVLTLINTAPQAADLGIAITGSPNPVPTGSNLTYTIVVTNNGPSAAPGVTMLDMLPTQTQFVSASPSQGSCSGTQTVTCGIGLLNAGASATIALVVTPTGGTQTITNTATVMGNVADSNTANDSATVVTMTSASDVTLIPGVTPIRAAHITDLRTRINAQRVRFGLAAAVWTDPTLTVGSTVVRAQHVAELRVALTQAYQAAGLTPPTYSDLSIQPGHTTIRAVHISELRDAVSALEQH